MSALEGRLARGGGMASTGAIVRDGNNTAGSTAALRALGVFYVGLTPGIIGSIWINMETLVGCSFPRSSDQFNKGPVLVHCLFNLRMF